LEYSTSIGISENAMGLRNLPFIERGKGLMYQYMPLQGILGRMVWIFINIQTVY